MCAQWRDFEATIESNLKYYMFMNHCVLVIENIKSVQGDKKSVRMYMWEQPDWTTWLITDFLSVSAFTFCKLN